MCDSLRRLPTDTALPATSRQFRGRLRAHRRRVGASVAAVPSSRALTAQPYASLRLRTHRLCRFLVGDNRDASYLQRCNAALLDPAQTTPACGGASCSI
eukprot:6214366-Pleurochrysis_carterae.AAC.2